MRTPHIIAILVVVVGIAVVVSTFRDTSTYSNFHDASSNPGHKLHIIGELNRDREIVYDTKTDINKFSFYMKDENGQECKVIYHDSKPHDFEKSDKVVAIGQMNGDVFEASKLLLKCPSKYNEEEVPEKFGETEYSSN